ncbi:MAG: hypothetical protein DI598_15665 [Pseudopedobacter saltans]|uniref:Ig-like domain-containing protein n=1 Tax=Pseudopedobacter saltans TaxID=151895 RepID=A0A2W5EPN5_9SPHI|nr:MAG: hypothetical protein DI598_15665 [Pseudopedobacter saltans]
MPLFKNLSLLVFTLVLCCSLQAQLSISTVLTNPKCNGGTDGIVVATASGGTAPYQYQLSEAGAGGWQSGSTFSSLKAGTYPVSVKDANNNYKTIYVTLTNPTAITASTISTSASCSNSYDATVSVTPSGGTAPYNYVWTVNGTLITSSNASTNHITGYNTSKIMGPSGSYSVAVTDNNGCSGAVTYYNPTPIALNSNSFNQDVIVESGASSVTAATTTKLDNDVVVGWDLFESGYGGSSAGLPTNRTITSLQDNTLTYNLQSYASTNNSARTLTGGVSTINFTTPTALAKLYLLGTSGNGQTIYSYQVKFSDGTTYPGNLTNNTVSFRDWYASSGPDISIRTLSRVSLTGTIDATNYALFESPITIPAQYYNKTISSITLTNASTTSSAGNIFAVTGYQASGTSSNVGYATSGVSQPSVVINSNLDSTTNYYCSGQQIIYSANTIHGGTNPTYVWQYSTDSTTWTTASSTTNTYTASPSSSYYYVRVTATASTDAGCLSSNTSNRAVFKSILNTIRPTVTISGSTNICHGTNASYTVTNKTNAGSAPTYTWLLDGTENSGLGTGTTTNTNSLTTGTHTIAIKMQSSITCATNNPVTSTAVSTVVNNSPTPTISISNLNSTIPITFKISDSSNLGQTPSYQWYLNGSAISNATSSAYTTSTSTASGDNYSLKVTSSALCASPATLMSNYRTIATALPIVLKSFIATAYSNNITLNWQTATEINTDRFEILRKYQDSSAFVTIGTVKATNITSGSSYQFVDYPKFAGYYQYRLKNYDFDGNYQLSNIQSIYYGNNNETKINKLYPNPFIDKVIISLNNLKSQTATLSIFNMNGIVVRTEKIQLNSGNQNIEVNNLNMFPSGVYILKVIDISNNIIATFKAIKK